MPKTRSPTDFRSIFEVRVAALDALRRVRDGQTDPAPIADAARALVSAAEKLDADVADRYRQFASVLFAVEMLHRWVGAIRSAEVDGGRYLNSARLHAREAIRAGGHDPAGERMVAFGERILAPVNPDEVDTILDEAPRIPLPLPFFAPDEPWGVVAREDPAPADDPRPVAFVSFALDGSILKSPAVVEPGVLHDLGVSVSLSRWPAEAESLILASATVEDPSTFRLPRFVFARPEGDPPHRLEARERLLLAIPQTIRSRPLQFAYRAWFTSLAGEIATAVEGQRQFELQSYDPAAHPVSGYCEVDVRLHNLRQDLRRHVGLTDENIATFLQVMTNLGALAAQSLQDALFRGVWSEDRFQDYVRDRMRLDPRIGAELEVHPHASGGITDLSFRGIRIELKVEAERAVTLETVEQFVSQTAQYVVGSDRRLGVLAVLDSTPKTDAPHGVANDIAIRIVEANGGSGLPTVLGVVIVRGNLAKPSDLSRKRRLEP